MKLIDLLILWLATYRLAKDLADEYGPLGAYAKTRKAVKAYVEMKVDETELEPKDHPLWWLHEGIDCPICLSFWFSFLVSRLPRFLTVPLACAGGVSLLYDFYKRFGR